MIDEKYKREILTAARHIDWQQVVFHQGAPCFQIEIHGEHPRFCGRAERWGGHDGSAHNYISLATLLDMLTNGGGVIG